MTPCQLDQPQRETGVQIVVQIRFGGGVPEQLACMLNAVTVVKVTATSLKHFMVDNIVISAISGNSRSVSQLGNPVVF